MSMQATEGVRSLHPEHLATFTESGIPLDAVIAAGIYSEDDPAKIAKILNWSRPATSLGSCVVIPFRKLNGEFNGFARVRPTNPREDGGKRVKYEQARGAALRAYFTEVSIFAASKPQALLAITEGEKKALAISLAGVPCIGLTGVFAYQKPGKKDSDGIKAERELIDDLAVIDWFNRCVLIIFDTDPRRNPSVNLAAAELARILESKGAEVIIIELPLGPDGTKMGADDFIVAHGADAFCELVDHQIAVLDAPARTVEDFQRDIARERKDSLQHKGIVNVDKSPTGAGKSYAATAAKQQAGTSLTILATHKNCAEEEENLALPD